MYKHANIGKNYCNTIHREVEKLDMNRELQCKALKLASLIDTQLLCQAELAERCVSVIDHFDPVDR